MSDDENCHYDVSDGDADDEDAEIDIVIKRVHSLQDDIGQPLRIKIAEV